MREINVLYDNYNDDDDHKMDTLNLSSPAVGSAAVYAGPPGRGRFRKKDGILGGTDGTVEDWHRCVRNLSVSSRENWAHRLIDGTGSYWQSCGQEGKVWRTTIINYHNQYQSFGRSFTPSSS